MNHSGFGVASFANGRLAVMTTLPFCMPLTQLRTHWPAPCVTAWCENPSASSVAAPTMPRRRDAVGLVYVTVRSATQGYTGFAKRSTAFLSSTVTASMTS